MEDSSPRRPPCYIPSVLDDAELLRRSVDDPDLFEEIFERHYDSVLRFGRQRLGHDVGEEVAARTMVIAFDRRASFDDAFRSCRPWLLGIATNLIRHHLRQERIHLAALARLPIDPDLDDEDTLDRLEAARQRPRLLEALEELTPGDRDAFTLVALSDLTYAEVAGALGVAEGTVGSRLHRARRSLREAMEALEATTDRRRAADGRRPGNDPANDDD
jgi:RNA polymerase sigma factor (sigma-70 family)